MPSNPTAALLSKTRRSSAQRPPFKPGDYAVCHLGHTSLYCIIVDVESPEYIRIRGFGWPPDYSALVSMQALQRLAANAVHAVEEMEAMYVDN